MTRPRDATRRSKRTEKLDLRLSRAAKQTLQAAAVAARKSVSEFVLDSALTEAEERLADRRGLYARPQEVGRFLSRRSTRRRAAIRACSAYFASPPYSSQKAKRDGFAPDRETAPHPMPSSNSRAGNRSSIVF